MGSKHHAMVDTHGRALKLLVHGAEVQDRHGAAPLFGIRASACNNDRVHDATSITIDIVHEFADHTGLVAYRPIKGDVVDQRRNLDAAVALARHQQEAPQIAQGIGQRRNLGRPATLGATGALALNPLFAP